jgi:hypothetical protein
MEAEVMKRAALLLVAILTVIAVDASIRGVDESREFTVVITDPENSLISYECGLEAKLRPGYWSAVKVAELENRMAEEVTVTFSQYFWVEGGGDIRFIGTEIPVSLQPFESKEVMGGFIVGEHATGGKLYFALTAMWPNGSAVVKTGACPLEVDVKRNAMSAWALPEEHFIWNEGWGGYFYYGGGDVRIPIYLSQNLQIGWLEIVESAGGINGTIICYNLTSSGYRIEKINLMLKTEEIMHGNTEDYPYVVENITQDSFCLEVSGFKEGYVAAHAVVR